MPIYSHSRLSTFEQCALKFKYKYIDKIIPPLEKSIEIHLGKVSHDVLEWVYLEVKKGYVPKLDEVLGYYRQKWEETWDPKIVIVRKDLTREDYYNKGIKFIINYYMKHAPFDENTLSVEERIMINLDDTGQYKIQGFIDRLVYNLKTEEYEVHDYKTANSLPLPEKVANDRQLALYSIAIKEKYGQDKEVLLVWHYLAFNRKIQSRRTNAQLEKLKKDTFELIKKIESTTVFNPNKTTLCNWCEYKTACPLWNDNPPTTKEEIEKVISKGKN
jgi:putative RecB family exonuclease